MDTQTAAVERGVGGSGAAGAGRAPVVKATGRGDQLSYRPCLRLYADSPAAEPLMDWASVWGDEVEVSILIAELETIPSGGTAFK
jgi:hypothetical protein